MDRGIRKRSYYLFRRLLISMGLLVRMLEKQKWEKVNLIELGHIKTPADTITSDLKTASNTLSLWLVENMKDIPKGVLALAVSRNKITRLDVMIFEDHELTEKGLLFKNTPENGHCPIEVFNDNHFDLTEMDYEKIGKFSELIISKLDDKEKCIRFDKNQINEILYDGFMRGAFLLEALHESLQTDLRKVISKKQVAEQ
jgi:hypothetical protein